MNENQASVVRHVTGALWALAVLMLAGVLSWSAWSARAEVSGLEQRRDALQREVDRARGENRTLREELRALEEDPVYVESLLRKRKRAAPGERILPPTGGR